MKFTIWVSQPQKDTSGQFREEAKIFIATDVETEKLDDGLKLATKEIERLVEMSTHNSASIDRFLITIDSITDTSVKP